MKLAIVVGPEGFRFNFDSFNKIYAPEGFNGTHYITSDPIEYISEPRISDRYGFDAEISIWYDPSVISLNELEISEKFKNIQIKHLEFAKLQPSINQQGPSVSSPNNVHEIQAKQNYQPGFFQNKGEGELNAFGAGIDKEKIEQAIEDSSFDNTIS